MTVKDSKPHTIPPLAAYRKRFGENRSRPFPELQEEAMRSFDALGFPGSHHEEWKYTGIRPIRETTFAAPTAPSVSRDDIEVRFPFLKGASYVVMENGRWNREASSLIQTPGLRILGMPEALSDPGVKTHFGKYADTHVDPFAAWNTAFSGDDLLAMIVEPGSKVDQTVYLVQWSDGKETVGHHRVLVLAGKESRISMAVICVSGKLAGNTLSNVVNEVVVGEKAEVEWDLLQVENDSAYQVCNTYVHQDAGSVFKARTVTTGGRIVRNKLHIRDAGERCETHMYGLYIADGDQLVDNHTGMFHASPRCRSDQLYKGMVGGRAQAVFNGKVIVERDAQQTNAYQSSKNLLLSNDAVVNAKPQLEIFADDVKCTHGATTGQLDDEALFYLRSRGLPRDEAVSMLNLAFAVDVLDTLPEGPFRGYVVELVRERLKKIRI